MGSGTVVVVDVRSEDSVDVSSAENQDPVQTFGADRPHPAFRECIGAGCPDRLWGAKNRITPPELR
jgi:hypothetical protein